MRGTRWTRSLNLITHFSRGRTQCSGMAVSMYAHKAVITTVQPSTVGRIKNYNAPHSEPVNNLLRSRQG